MKAKELINKTEKELYDMLVQQRAKLGQLSFEKSSKKIKNIREIRSVRRGIARLLTVIKKKKESYDKE